MSTSYTVHKLKETFGEHGVTACGLRLFHNDYGWIRVGGRERRTPGSNRPRYIHVSTVSFDCRRCIQADKTHMSAHLYSPTETRHWNVALVWRQSCHRPRWGKTIPYVLWATHYTRNHAGKGYA